MIDIDKVKFDEKGLVPAVVQEANGKVLMLAYMNKESLQKTIETGYTWFYSRSRQELWNKGATSGNKQSVSEIYYDCDGDTLLVKAKPLGPTCHTGTDTCWGETNEEADFLFFLQKFLQKRKNDSPEESYTARLISKGINKIAQKVGEEAVELVIEAKDDNEDLFLNEAADLMYHYLVLLIAKGYGLEDVIRVLKERHK